ncbi:hypothetical protein N7488_006355 [Penicillium malachiteum]|nr:hypothetical protein N7488_006355 [Penicillium malachiteum]
MYRGGPEMFPSQILPRSRICFQQRSYLAISTSKSGSAPVTDGCNTRKSATPPYGLKTEPDTKEEEEASTPPTENENTEDLEAFGLYAVMLKPL